MNPCISVLRRLMPDTAWRTFLRANPSWHAPVLAAVACAGVAGAPLPAGPSRAALPWIGASGWVQHGANEYPSGGLPSPLSASIAPGGLLGGGGAALFETAQTARRLEPALLAVGGNPTVTFAPTAPIDVPEPATVALLALGIVGAVLGRRVFA